ncbi:MAG: S8 family serine peptidase, partial [Microscillaceae bacterium]|nr:S8 family serine peptidase [Microscillaceae bacterium]
IAQGINPSAKGMAFGASLDAFTSSNDYSEMALAASRGMLVSNHSYGPIAGFNFGDFGAGQGWYWFGNTEVSTTEDASFGRYGFDERIADDIAYQAPYYLPVWAAGNDRNDTGPATGVPHFVFGENGWESSTETRQPDGGEDGYDAMPGEGLAKNILSVGAINGIDAGYSNPNQVVIATFSAFGPTDDGRIKPDVVGHGVDVFSAGGASTTSYGSSSGTSFSAPNVSGSLFLLQEHYQNLRGDFMRAATLRALAIHTAFEAGTTEGPDYRFGWGLLNTAGAADVITANGTEDHILENTLLNGETFNLDISTTEGQPLTLTLAWTDLPGEPFNSENLPDFLNNPKLMLIHDLDVRISGGGQTYEPYILDPSNPANPANRGDNFRDNVEKIYVANPGTGTLTVSLSHKGTLSAPQAFSMIISGATLPGDLPPVVANPIANVVVNQGSENTLINIANVFDDPDNDNNAIVKTIIANTNPNLVTPTLQGNNLTLAYNPTRAGIAYITIRATSNGKTTQEEFEVNVIADPVSLLYDQSSDAIGAINTGLPSMQLTNFDNDEIRIADDFEVPSGQIWEVKRVNVEGFNNAQTPMPNVRILLFADDAGKPGPELYDSGTINPLTSPTDYNFEIALPTPQLLNPGVYWVCVMAVDDFLSASSNGGVTDGWFWLLGQNPLQGSEPKIIEVINEPEEGEEFVEVWTDITDVFDGLGTSALNMLFTVSGDITYTAPTALPADQITPVSFRANWLAIPEADEYRLDVSEDNFATFLVEDAVLGGEASSFTVSGLESGQDYQYRLRFLSAEGISDYSNTIEVTTCVEPDQAASNITFNNDPVNAMRIFWTPGNGDGRLVLVKAGTAFSPADLPVDGVTYTANATFGNGSQIGASSVVFAGNNLSSLLIFNLQDGVNYFVAVIEYGCDIPYYNTLAFANASNVVTSLGEDLTINSLEIFPNPAEEQLRVRMVYPGNQVLQFQLLDPLGRAVQQLSTQARQGKVDVRLQTGQLPKGLYYLSISDGDDRIVRKVVLK